MILFVIFKGARVFGSFFYSKGYILLEFKNKLIILLNMSNVNLKYMKQLSLR